jgi:hypothetical protein
VHKLHKNNINHRLNTSMHYSPFILADGIKRINGIYNYKRPVNLGCIKDSFNGFIM